MDKPKCQHIRIRKANGCDGYSPEEWINSLEEELKLDIRTIPQWEEITKRLLVTATECKIHIQDAQMRKKHIAQKLFLEYTRFTPFELTDRFSRTAKKWEQMEKDLKHKKINSVSHRLCSDLSPSLSSEQTEGLHPNSVVAETEIETEIILSEKGDRKKRPINLRNEKQDISSSFLPHLPENICMNKHKLISPLASQHSSIGIVQHQTIQVNENKKDVKAWMLLKHTTSIECSPPKLNVIYSDLNKQFLTFSLINRSRKFMFIRYKKLINRSPFKAPKLEPKNLHKIYPGIPLNFIFSFKLRDFRDEFISEMYFKVGHDVYKKIPDEILIVPIVSDFKRGRYVSVPETVVLPSLYPWHFAMDSTKATVEISIDDGRDYHLHIVKRVVDHVPEYSKEKWASTEVICPSTGSVEGRSSVTDSTFTAGSDAKSKQGITSISIGFGKSNPQYCKYYISLIVTEIVERALDTFYFECTYVPFLISYPKKVKIDVYFSKIERTGWHYAYYDFKFFDPRTEDVVLTKTMMVFVEVLAHPIKLEPELLDMTETPVVHGLCKDKFVITNSNIFYAVSIKICLTRQMKKIFRIIPMSSRIASRCSATFQVKFCTIDRSRNCQNNVHFNIKILASGNKLVYSNVPPIYYEIIAPCETFFNHLKRTPNMLVDPVELAF